MKTVLVTGPIGAGKSAACRYLSSLGWPVYDCDSRCKALYSGVPGLKEEIERRLGIPFSELGQIFTDPQKKRLLEELVYPLLSRDIARWKESLDSRLAFVESATAAGRPEFEGLWDTVLLVTAPARLRQERNPAAQSRGPLQHFPRGIADRTIRNTGSPEELHVKLDKYLRTI